jgi:glycosyltransferase involved in cell wall biosynthesis
MPSAKALSFVISADYARRTGGWLYDHKLVQGLSARGWQVRRITLPAGFPQPSPPARAQAGAAFRAIADGSLVLVDQLCLGVLPEVAAAAGHRLRLVMIVHHPLALEGYATVTAVGIARAEREALRHVAGVITTSANTARVLASDYAVSADRIVIAVPGVDRQALARGSGGSLANLISVGAVVPRKNHGLLVEALGGLAGLPWRLAIVGNLTRAGEHVRSLRAMITAYGLSARIRLTGELPDQQLARLWSGADLYVSTSRHEGYGMAMAEAFAHGVPVLTTYAGAAGAWIGRRGAKIVGDGRLVALRTALGELIGSRHQRALLRRGAVARRRSLPAWEATAAVVDARLKQLVASRS